MKEIKNKNVLYEEPELQIIHMTETDIITTSGGEEIPQEGEFIPGIG